MTVTHLGVEKFGSEINRLEDENVKAFAHNAVVAAPESFWQDETLVSRTKKVFCVVEHLLAKDEVPSPIKDVILTGTLLCDMAYNELKEKGLEDMHNVAAKTMLKDVVGDLNPSLFEAVIKIIQSHEDTGAVYGLEAKPGGPEHLVQLAQRIVEANFITIDTDLEGR